MKKAHTTKHDHEMLETATPQERATIQDLHLELIRRSSFNFLDGPRVVRDLEAHRDLWLAVLIDRDGMPWGSDMIKLRDIPENVWNVDKLFVLARDERAARRLTEFAERWRADEVDVQGEEATERALGRGRVSPERLVTFWWD
ncbi:MAG: hypothetical protein ACAI25_15075 [Planctomycetota bacterium]